MNVLPFKPDKSFFAGTIEVSFSGRLKTKKEYFWKVTIIVISKNNAESAEVHKEDLGNHKTNDMTTGDSKSLYVDCNHTKCNCKTTNLLTCVFHTRFRG